MVVVVRLSLSLLLPLILENYTVRWRKIKGVFLNPSPTRITTNVEKSKQLQGG